MTAATPRTIRLIRRESTPAKPASAADVALQDLTRSTERNVNPEDVRRAGRIL
jgi:hypothetical protein